MNYLFFDLETTGLDPWRHDIITACFILTDENYKTIDILETKTQPDASTWWDKEAEKIHGISYQETQKWESRARTCVNIIKFLDQNGVTPNNTTTIIQANPNRWFNEAELRWNVAWFDKEMLFAMFWKEDMTFLLRKHLVFRERDNIKTLWSVLDRLMIKPRTLKEACKRAKINLDNHHDARADTEALIKVWKHFEQKTREGNRVGDTYFFGNDSRGRILECESAGNI